MVPSLNSSPSQTKSDHSTVTGLHVCVRTRPCAEPEGQRYRHTGTPRPRETCPTPCGGAGETVATQSRPPQQLGSWAALWSHNHHGTHSGLCTSRQTSKHAPHKQKYRPRTQPEESFESLGCGCASTLRAPLGKDAATVEARDRGRYGRVEGQSTRLRSPRASAAGRGLGWASSIQQGDHMAGWGGSGCVVRVATRAALD